MVRFDDQDPAPVASGGRKTVVPFSTATASSHEEAGRGDIAGKGAPSKATSADPRIAIPSTSPFSTFTVIPSPATSGVVFVTTTSSVQELTPPGFEPTLDGLGPFTLISMLSRDRIPITALIATPRAPIRLAPSAESRPVRIEVALEGQGPGDFKSENTAGGPVPIQSALIAADRMVRGSELRETDDLDAGFAPDVVSVVQGILKADARGDAARFRMGLDLADLPKAG